MKKKVQWIVLAVVMLAASRAQAGNCSWTTVPPDIIFGTYSVFGAGSLNAVANYQIRCTPNTTGVLTVTTGANSGNYASRYMANGGSLLGYNLYIDAANSTVAGDGTGGTGVVDLVNATPQNKDFPGTIYGATPQGSDVPPGVYTDTVMAVLTWDAGSKSLSRSFLVQTTVQPECVVTTTPVSFGTYDPVGTHAASPLDSTGGINVYCTIGTTGTVSLGNGQNFGGGTRRMAGPAGSFLSYLLYNDAGRSSIWSVAPDTVSGTSTSRTVPINNGMTVYGRIPAGQDPVVGLHNDTVQATVNY